MDLNEGYVELYSVEGAEPVSLVELPEERLSPLSPLLCRAPYEVEAVFFLDLRVIDAGTCDRVILEAQPCRLYVERQHATANSSEFEHTCNVLPAVSPPPSLIQGDPCDELGQGPAKRARSSKTPDKREARLAREAENKVNENSMESEARLAGDRARKVKKRAGETPVNREARLQKEAQNRAQRLFDDSFALAG
eukprot:750385-Hanusia_phi.AAC.2